MSTYSGQEIIPGQYETRIELLESEIADGADPDLLMTEPFRRHVHSLLAQVLEDNAVQSWGELNDSPVFKRLGTMAKNPFNHQAQVLHEAILEEFHGQSGVLPKPADLITIHKASLRAE